MLEFLLDQGAGANISSKEGATPLHLSARKGADELSELLLQRGACMTVPWKTAGAAVALPSSLFSSTSGAPRTQADVYAVEMFKERNQLERMLSAVSEPQVGPWMGACLPEGGIVKWHHKTARFCPAGEHQAAVAQELHGLWPAVHPAQQVRAGGVSNSACERLLALTPSWHHISILTGRTTARTARGSCAGRAPLRISPSTTSRPASGSECPLLTRRQPGCTEASC
jgi:hypothetical protein